MKKSMLLSAIAATASMPVSVIGKDEYIPRYESHQDRFSGASKPSGMKKQRSKQKAARKANKKRRMNK